MDAFRARTACSATTRSLAGGSSATTWRMNSGTALPLDLAMMIYSPWICETTRGSARDQTEQRCHHTQGRQDEDQADQGNAPAVPAVGAKPGGEYDLEGGRYGPLKDGDTEDVTNQHANRQTEPAPRRHAENGQHHDPWINRQQHRQGDCPRRSQR